MADTTASRNIVFVHPDLGIGGAERLVIDAAVGLQSTGHKITILTSYRDPNHCFEEARDGTLDVRVRGDALFPSSLGGQLSILFSILRQLALVASTGILTSELKRLDPDIFIVDQLSACVPFFRLLHPRAKILFYGHYPDRLLAKEETGLRRYFKKLYRIPFDAFEEWSTNCADAIVVNSRYTKSVFKSTFSSMKKRDLKVIYPCVDTEGTSIGDPNPIWSDRKVLLSINRFEGKKNLDLAIQAFAGLSPQERSKTKLVVAGGYDPRNHENNITHTHLQELSGSLNLSHTTLQGKSLQSKELSSVTAEVLFLLSIPHEIKVRLLRSAGLLIYTPRNEHFGIVPLEAMLVGVPVLATNTGGPLETIYDGRTGWLRDPAKISQWTDVMRKPLIPSSAENLQRMGQQGRDRVLAEFSQTKMTHSFEKEIEKIMHNSAQRPNIMPVWFLYTTVVMLFTILAVVGAIRYMRYTVNHESAEPLGNIMAKVSRTAKKAVNHATASKDEL